MKLRKHACEAPAAGAHERPPALLALAATALVLTACGGSGLGSTSGTPMVSPLMSQTINQDTPTPPLAFTVSDDGGADVLTLSVRPRTRRSFRSEASRCPAAVRTAP